jgi:hypothetical protein
MENEILWHRRIRLTFMVPELVIVCYQERPPNPSTQKEEWPKHTLWHSAAQICADVCSTHMYYIWHSTTTTHITNQLTDSTAGSPQNANGSSPSQIPHISTNPKVRFRVHKSPPPVPTLRQINPVHAYPAETVCNKQAASLP